MSKSGGNSLVLQALNGKRWTPPKSDSGSDGTSTDDYNNTDGNNIDSNNSSSNNTDSNNSSSNGTAKTNSISDFPPPSAFDLDIAYPALIVPVRQTATLRRKLKPVLLYRPRFSNVVRLSQSDLDDAVGTALDANSYRKLVLDSNANQPATVWEASVFQDMNIQSLQSSSSLTDTECCFRSTHTVRLRYQDWTVEEILTYVLPRTTSHKSHGCQNQNSSSTAVIPSAFEVIGTIAHLNLHDAHLPYKHWIGKVILDKNRPRIRTVVNKIGTIDNVYRTFPMEVIAGDANDGWSVVTMKEEGCLYTMDFQTVYWNSRLGGEHRRLVDIIWNDYRSRKKQQQQQQQRGTLTDKPFIVADVMAGIGPFSVPLASRETATAASSFEIHANDLNPESFKYLQINAERNGCRRLTVYNMDGRQFCRRLQEQRIFPRHVIMNLPASAPEFLDAFRSYDFGCHPPPRIHVHCFAVKDEYSDSTSIKAEQQVTERCSKALGCTLHKDKHDVYVHTVRDVAPKKNMYCISFDLPNECKDLPPVDLSSSKRKADERESGDTADNGNGNGNDNYSDAPSKRCKEKGSEC